MTDKAFIERQRVIRRDVLAALYVARRQRQAVYVRQLIYTLGFAPDECRFAFDYLLEAGRIRSTGIECQITSAGIEQFEQEHT